MTPRFAEDWHRHGLRSPDEVAQMIADRVGGTSDAAGPAGADHDEPSYADFLGEQV
ncbi:hypothetical protein [Curtobacterium citri]|uniref:Uncharacterized protein n=1 Tax=Curtobacterium citri TaxID=3055139 RepID=A0ABT7T9X4_9MICO|nr:hypothetical protein [Curtobacterium citri]MDM7886370.1 hypothetical protein [Curtobacterium citri]